MFATHQFFLSCNELLELRHGEVSFLLGLRLQLGGLVDLLDQHATLLKGQQIQIHDWNVDRVY